MSKIIKGGKVHCSNSKIISYFCHKSIIYKGKAIKELGLYRESSSRNILKHFTILIAVIGISTLSMCFKLKTENFYHTFSSDSISIIDACLNNLAKENKSSKVNAYTGALRMKKASLLKNPKDKLTEFKTGRNMLEREILLYPENVEYRFLRLAIQENCPKFLKYKQNITEDLALIKASIQTIDANLFKAIEQYAQNSILLESIFVNTTN